MRARQTKQVRALAVSMAALGIAVGAKADSIRGERVSPDVIAPGVVETLEAAIERDKTFEPRPNPRTDFRLRFGEWRTPTPRSSSDAHSGRHYVINSWGDTRMGIGFNDVVDVDGAYIIGHEDEGVRATALQAIGYLDGDEVARTDIFRNIGDRPHWFEMDLCGVDRIEIVATPQAHLGGWYGIDDLTYSPVGNDDRAGTVVDFDDLGYKAKISGTEYAGLTWEFGTGSDYFNPMPGPRIEPGAEEKPPHGTGGVEPQGAVAGGAGTLPVLEDTFPVQSETNSFPPDTIGAIGPFHFVETVNSIFAVYSRITGSQLTQLSLGSFLPGSSGDPRVLFDQHTQRWIVLATDFDEHIYIAVSLTESATGGWFKTSFDAAEGIDANRWVDYPTLGVDENGIYITANMFGGGVSATIFALEKAPMVDPSPSLGVITAFRGLPTDGAVQPTHTYGSAPGAYFVSTSTSGLIRVRRVNPPLTSPTLSNLNAVSVPGYSSPPDAEALGSSTNVDTGDRRLIMSVYRDGSIWTAHTINIGGRAGCRWYQFDPESSVLQQTGDISNPSRDYYYPSIMVNKFGTVLMGFSGSNSGTFINAYYTGREAGDPSGAMATPEVYQFGVGGQTHIDNVGRNRWGDYSYTTLDPTNETGLWTVQAYADGTNNWGTAVAYTIAGDCNQNGILDDCDIDCGDSGGACDVVDCGLSEDCDRDGIPDECEETVGACCLPDGGCCEYANAGACNQLFGTYNGDGSTCDAVPECPVADAVLTCVQSSTDVLAGGSATVEIFVENVDDLSTYQVTALLSRVSGTVGTLDIDCSSCTGGSNEPACGARVDDARADYVFNGENGFGVVSCDSDALGAVLLSGSVAVGPTPAYLGEYTVDISGDAEPGDVLQLAIGDGSSESFLVQSTGDLTPYVTGAPCSFTVADPGDCFAPTAVGEGSKTILVTPQGLAPQALLVSGAAGDPEVGCVSLYVQADGTLGPTPVVQTPDVWGTVAVHGVEIIPDETYDIQAECGALLTSPVSATTWPWGDVEAPPNGTVNFADIQLVVQAFQVNYANVTLERADIEPCEPNRSVNFADIQLDVQAFQGQSYAATGCPIPCP